ncbi:Uncharacterised protein [Yersinia frederiksenii]|nr:Uncharacterised protein [Yersinia frederiksenii]
MRLQQDAHYIAQILDNFKRRLRIIHGEVSYNIFDTLLRDLALKKPTLR